MAGRARGKRAAVVRTPAPPAPEEQHARTRLGSRTTRLVEVLHAHEHRTAAGLFALVVIVYLWPALVGTGVLSPVALMYGIPPWNTIPPPTGLEHINQLLADVPLSYYPWDVLARDLLHAGTFPAWNEYAFAGTPLFANLSVAWLSPFSLPLWTLPLNYALGLAAALKLWVAAFGTYLLVRELRLGFWPAILAGVSFALCAFNVVWLSHGAHISVAVLLPWLIWLAERIVRRGGRAEGIALALVVACALAGGHPGTQVHVLAGTLLYTLVRLATTTDVAWEERLRRLATVGGGMLVGVLLMAVVLLPGLLATADTIGADARLDGAASSLIGTKLPLDALRTALFPDWWGRPSEAVVTGPANYNERAFYAGALTLILAVLALVSPGAWRRKVAFVVLLAIGLAVPLAAEPVRTIVVNLPGFDRVQNQRLLLWFAFAVAVLGAFGLQAILDAPRRSMRAWAVLGAAAAAGLIGLASIELAPGDVGRALSHLSDRFAQVTLEALALASVLRWLLLVSVCAGLLLLLRTRPRWAALAGGLIALTVALDMLLFAHAYQPIGPASQIFPPSTGAIAYLQRHANEERIAGITNTVLPDSSTLLRLRDARGYDAPQPTKRFFRMWRLLNPEQNAWRPFEVPALSPEAVRTLGMLGTRYVIARTGTPLPDDSQLRELSFAYRGDDAVVIENPLAAPRASVAERVRVASDEDAEIAAIAAAEFDPRSHVVVRHDETGDAAPKGSNGTVRIVQEENARVTLQARLDGPGIVVLNDAWAPGWSVEVDGKSAPALQTNVVLRGVAVDAGEHEIVWSYRVPGLRLGLLLSLVGLLALAAWAGVLVARSRRITR